MLTSATIRYHSPPPSPLRSHVLSHQDPLLPKDVVAHCGTCKTFGYTNFVQNDPIYKNMGLWTEGAFYNVTNTDAPKVKLEVYFEALCPGCQEFTTGTLVLLTPTLPLSPTPKAR
jgi:hypothetical protein